MIDCGAITIVDAQGAATLHEILALAEDHGVTVRLARVKPSVRATLARDGVVDRLGADRLHGSVHRAVEAHRAQARDVPASRPAMTFAFASAYSTSSRCPSRCSWLSRSSRLVTSTGGSGTT